MFNFARIGEFASYFFGTGPAPPPQNTGKAIAAKALAKLASREVQEVISETKNKPTHTKRDPDVPKTETKKEAEVQRIVRENRDDPKTKWENDLNEKPAFEAEQTSAEIRHKKIVDVPKISVFLPFKTQEVTSKRRQMLFLNPGERAIRMAAISLQKGWDPPKWAARFPDNITLKGDRLLFDGLIMATPDEKRLAVKRKYFDPKQPSTINPITDELRGDWANITRRDVRNILRSFETYQRNFGRRKPPDIMGKMNLSSPGVIAMDMFFPSKLLGWRKINVLACIDCWSRFCWCYALERKDYRSTEMAMQNFLQRFASLGQLPRKILCDKGTDLAPAHNVIEPYRHNTKGPMVFHSATGTPVNIIEAFNAQVQRRLQVFRTAKITDDVSVILDDICEQLNNQKRPTRGNMTPLQLLTLDKAQRTEVNKKNRVSREYVSEVEGLKPLFLGDHVRLLLMTRKEQAAPKMTYKGFAPKWSKRVYTVIKMTALQKNKEVYRYYIGKGEHYFRHELLKIPKKVDQEVLKDMVSHKENVIAPEEEEWQEQWEMDAYDSDDSRA